jgi:two-component system response regulator
MKILLVEDNPDDVQLTLRAFRKSNIGNEVIVAKDGQEALDFFFGESGVAGKSRDDLPALVLLDLQLPKVNGIEVLRRIRADERTKLVPVVILTSSREQIDMQDGYANGCNSYIRKPVDFNQFAEAVRQLGLYWLVLNEAPRRSPDM